MKNFSYPFALLGIIGIIAGIFKEGAEHQLLLGLVCLILALAFFCYGESSKSKEWEGWM